jgi:hypothetical protein
MRGHRGLLWLTSIPIGMLGWLRGFESFLAMIRLRTLPGGWMGLVMILTGLLGLICDLATNLVTTAYYDRRCSFTTGVVVSDHDSGRYPSPYGAAALYTQAAQLSTVSTFDLDNRPGLQGIYRGFDPSKIDIFFATENDIVGLWQCKNSSQILLFENQSDDAIAHKLLSQDYIYEAYIPNRLISTGPSTQLVILSASSTEFGDPWNLKIAVDMKDDNEGSSKSMQVRTCTLEVIDPLVENIRNNINITQVLSDWGLFFQSNLYEGFNSDHPDNGDGTDTVSQVLELLLNSIIMVAGTQSSVNMDSDGLEYGCLHSGSRINYGIAALVLIVCSMDLFFIFYWLYLRLKLVKVKRHYDQTDAGRVIDSSELCNCVPNSILDWIVHAAHGSDDSGSQPKHHHLRKWLLSVRSYSGRRVGLVQKHGNRHGVPASSVVSPNFAPPTNTFLSQKTGYNAVRTSETWIPNA